MKKIFFLAGVACIIAYSCSSGNKRSSDETVISDSLAIEQSDSDLVVFPSDSGTVHLDLTNGKEELTIHKDKDQTIYLIFDSKGYKKISAQLSSQDSIANIRFSQITMPDGKMDGPFGRELDYNLPADGTYKLSIHESLMAGDPWSGDFTVKVQLTK